MQPASSLPGLHEVRSRYWWRQEYGGLKIDQVKRMKELDADMVLMTDTPDHVAPVMKKAFDTPGPVIVGVHVDDRDNHKSFEIIKGDNFH
jgi:thiamine pyrophosphate-dependent acetolactate synthase large subunit-like protein